MIYALERPVTLEITKTAFSRVMPSAQNPEIGSKKGILRGFEEDEKIKKSVFLRTYKAKMVDLDRVHHFL